MKSIASYIARLLTEGIYCFSWEELRVHLAKTDVSLRRELSRLVEKKQILAVRKGVYLIEAPGDNSTAPRSIERYADKLFQYLNKPYYAGAFSAARRHGASNLHSDQDCIVIPPPALLDINRNGIMLDFYTTSKWPAKNILQQGSDAGYLNISSLVLTMVDCLHHQTKLGGINHVSCLFAELAEEVEEEDIIDLLTWYPHKSTLQRLGFCLEQNEAEQIITQPIYAHLCQTHFYPVLLSPDGMKKAGAVNNRWKVADNQEMGSGS